MSSQKANLAKIHIARQQLGMDEDSYRALLARIAGVQSAKALLPRQAHAVLNEFQRLGWVPTRSARAAKGKPQNFNQLPLYIRKVEALLADMKLPWSYADALAKQMFKVERVAWIKRPSQLEKILAALYYEQQKRYYQALGNRLLEKLLEKLQDHPNTESLRKNFEILFRQRKERKKELDQFLGYLASLTGEGNGTAD